MTKAPEPHCPVCRHQPTRQKPDPRAQTISRAHSRLSCVPAYWAGSGLLETFVIHFKLGVISNHMTHRRLIQLVLTLVAAAAMAILVHLRWPADGFFLNLAAGFVGSLVTVGYIDWILKRHEQERWSEADSRINARLIVLASATITGVRSAFGFGTEIFEQKVLREGSAGAMRKEVLRIATHVLSPAAEARIAALNQKQWQLFVAHLQESATECGNLLDRFGHRLEPRLMAILLDLQQHLEAAQTFWRLFPDIAGVPVAQLPNTTTPPGELQTAWCELTAKDIQKVLELSVRLSSEANDTQSINAPDLREKPREAAHFKR